MKNFSIAILMIALPGLSDAASTLASYGASVVRLSPQIRMDALPLPQAPLLRPAPMPPVVADEAAVALAPRIVASREERTHLAGADRIDVAGQVGDRTEFLIVRPAARLRDPVSGTALGRELRPLGTAKLLRRDDNGGDGVHAAVIAEATREITTGDLLWPLPAKSGRDELPINISSGKLPDAAIISIADGAAYAAQNQVVGINKGTQDGVVDGAAFALFVSGQPAGAAMQPGESGQMRILRAFVHVSYGLITQAIAPVQVGDKARAVSRGR